MPRGGYRPNSGRKPLLEEKKLIDLLEVSHATLVRWMNNPDVPDDRKVAVAAELLKRRIPNATEIEGSLDTGAVNYILIRNSTGEIPEAKPETGQVHLQQN